MAIVIMQTWDGITPGQYDALRETVGWDRDVPSGMRLHVASFGDGILRMTDVWDRAGARRPHQPATRSLPAHRNPHPPRPEVARKPPLSPGKTPGRGQTDLPS